ARVANGDQRAPQAAVAPLRLLSASDHATSSRLDIGITVLGNRPIPTAPFFALLFATLAWLFWSAPTRAQVYSVDSVKAAFLYRFASYVEWPEEVASGPF